MVLREGAAACESTCTRPSRRERSAGSRGRDVGRYGPYGRSRGPGKARLPGQAPDRAEAAGAAHSYDVVLANELARRETGCAQRPDVQRGTAVDDELGDELAGRRRVH